MGWKRKCLTVCTQATWSSCIPATASGTGLASSPGHVAIDLASWSRQSVVDQARSLEGVVQGELCHTCIPQGPVFTEGSRSELRRHLRFENTTRIKRTQLTWCMVPAPRLCKAKRTMDTPQPPGLSGSRYARGMATYPTDVAVSPDRSAGTVRESAQSAGQCPTSSAPGAATTVPYHSRAA